MSARPRIKFCGMTRREDAVAAADLGADAIGFVLWEGSPRHVDPVQARAIAGALPPWVWRVGVFVDAPLESMRQAVDLIGLDVVQLHGDESPDVARALRTRVIKAVGRAGLAAENAIAAWDDDVLLLVDAVDPVRRGGTGERADWSLARSLASRRRIVLAGGLSPDNVADGLRAVQPYAVDVASGIEARPGVKDKAKMRAFVDAVEGALRTDANHV